MAILFPAPIGSEPEASVKLPVALLPGDTDCPPLTAFLRVLIVDVAAILLALILTKSFDNDPLVGNLISLLASVVNGADVLPAILQY